MTAAGASCATTTVPTRPAPPGRPPALDARRLRARELGRELGALLDDPDALTGALRDALIELADEPYRRELRRVAPGIDVAFGVRGPLLGALVSGLRPALRRARPAEALWIAEPLSRQRELELRLVALTFLRRSLPEDPERTWQLIRRLGRHAGDWISVDALAGLAAEGILREPYRWAEIEQLVYATNPWERRLAGSTVAVLRSTGRELATRRAIPAPPGGGDVDRGLAIVGSLIGDDDPNVRKALSWALRELAAVDRGRVGAFIAGEVERAVAERDGNRAWVLRDALSKLEPATAATFRARLAGLRRRAGSPSTSRAATVAQRFGGLRDPRTSPEPPL